MSRTDKKEYKDWKGFGERTKKAREYILDNIMLKEIAKPRENLSKYAPKITKTKISV